MRRALLTAVILAALPAMGAAGSLSRDHDELPRVIACQEKLHAAIEDLRLALRGYDLALDIRAAERPGTARSDVIVTCRLREADAVPVLTTPEEKL